MILLASLYCLPLALFRCVVKQRADPTHTPNSKHKAAEIVRPPQNAHTPMKNALNCMQTSELTAVPFRYSVQKSKAFKMHIMDFAGRES